MPFYVLELHPGLWPSKGRAVDPGPAPKTNGWRFFAHCHEDDLETCDLLYSDPADFKNVQRAFKDFQALMAWLYEAGKSGVSWRDIIKDGNLFHSVHSFKVTRTENGRKVEKVVEVLQFKRARTNVRVLTVQSGIGSCNAFVTHAFEKDSAQTPASEQRRAEDGATAFFQALDAGQVQLITSQQGDGDDANQSRFR